MAPLHSVATATCVRVREGKRFVTDGPFAETREQLGGYFFITANDQAEAVEIASRIPGARIGTVEVRPVLELENLSEKNLRGDNMQKITTNLWFDGNAEEAAKFYTSLFKDAKITSLTRCGEAGPVPVGSALFVVFELAGQ